MKQQNKRLNWMILFMMILFMLHEMPIIGIYYPSALYSFLTITLFVLLLILLRRSDVKNLLGIYALFILNIITSLLLDLDLYRFLLNVSGLLQTLIYTLMAFVLIRLRDYQNARTLLVIYLLIHIITAISTYIGCQIYPGASRALAVTDVSNEEYFQLYSKLNIGGFSFIYSLVLLVPLLIISYKNSLYFNRGRLIKLFSAFSIILFGFTIFKSEYTTAILIYIVTTFLILLSRRLKSRKLTIVILISLSLFLLFKSYIGSHLVELSASVGSEDVSSRLIDLGMTFQGKQISTSESDIIERMDKYQKSISSFVHQPIGTWFFQKPNIGGHSFLFDNMAKYGIIAIILFCLMIRSLFLKYIKKYKHRSYYGYATFMLIIFSILCVVNPGAFLIQITFTLPLFLFILECKSVD